MKVKEIIEVDENIKEKAIKCEKRLSCLFNTSHELCKVIRSAHDEIIFIECLEYKHCNYKSSFGFSSNICNCPVRKELYRKYNI